MAKKESGPGRPQGGQLLLQKGTGPSDEEVLTTSPEKNKETRSTDASAAESALTAQAAEPSASKPFPIVGIGASAGGLEAFTAFLKALPADTGMAFVLIQHMDPTHERDRKSTRLNSSHGYISYAVFCLKKKKHRP